MTKMKESQQFPVGFVATDVGVPERFSIAGELVFFVVEDRMGVCCGGREVIETGVDTGVGWNTGDDVVGSMIGAIIGGSFEGAIVCAGSVDGVAGVRVFGTTCASGEAVGIDDSDAQSTQASKTAQS
jgi:hypothetical protein